MSNTTVTKGNLEEILKKNEGIVINDENFKIEDYIEYGIDGKRILRTNIRCLWYLREHPEAAINTDLIESMSNAERAVVHAKIYEDWKARENDCYKSDGYGQGVYDQFSTFGVKFILCAETEAIGRALAHLGYFVIGCENEFGIPDVDLAGIVEPEKATKDTPKKEAELKNAEVIGFAPPKANDIVKQIPKSISPADGKKLQIPYGVTKPVKDEVLDELLKEENVAENTNGDNAINDEADKAETQPLVAEDSGKMPEGVTENSEEAATEPATDSSSEEPEASEEEKETSEVEETPKVEPTPEAVTETESNENETCKEEMSDADYEAFLNEKLQFGSSSMRQHTIKELVDIALSGDGETEKNTLTWGAANYSRNEEFRDKLRVVCERNKLDWKSKMKVA